MSDILRGFNIERSRNDFKHFYEWVGYVWGDHIAEWDKLYRDRGDSQVHRVCIIAPRDHSKSTTLRMVMLHQCLFNTWRDKPFTIWLFSASKELAANRLEEIRGDMMRHRELRKFIDTRRGGKLNLRFTNGAWIKATGIGSAIRGEHPACIAMDDVLDDTGDITPESTRHWFRKKITPMLSPGTWMYCVGTPMGMTDLYHSEMLENKAWKTWYGSAFPNWDEWKADPDNVDLACLWPEHRSLDFLMEQKDAMGDLAFVQEYLCKVVDVDAQVYSRYDTRAHLESTDILMKGKELEGKYAIGFDPAHGLGRDYSVMVVVRQDKQGDLHFVDMWRRNDFPPAKQVDEILSMCKKYDGPAFACEEAGFQRLYEQLLIERGAMVDFRGSKVSNKILKQALLNRLRVWFEQQRVHFPYGDDKTRRTVNIILEELDHHVWKQGDIADVGRHNDCVMALAHAVDQFYTWDSSMPIATAKIEGSKWLRPDGKEKKSRYRSRPSSGRYRIF